MEGTGLKIDLYMIYMDDGRIILYPLKRGWKWIDTNLVYCKKRELEDEQETLLSITVRALQESMKGVANYLQFTYKTGRVYEGGWLPTLDTNQILYKYYKKMPQSGICPAPCVSMYKSLALTSIYM